MRLRDLDEIIRNLYEYRELQKGIFWFTCEFTRDGEADFSESEIIYLSIPCNCDGDLEAELSLIREMEPPLPTKNLGRNLFLI